jgi:hypothetical protein
MMQVLWIVETHSSGHSWQGLPFNLANHPQMQQLERFKATHFREQVAIELAVLIHKTNRGPG